MKNIKHKISLCSDCGNWVHDTINVVSSYQSVLYTDGNMARKRLIRAVCESCKDKYEKLVLCPICGEKVGDNLTVSVFEVKRFDKYNMCNIVLALCIECRKKPQEQIIEEIKFDGVDVFCPSCPDRYNCHTSQDDKPQIVVEDKNTGIRRNYTSVFQRYKNRKGKSHKFLGLI